MKQKSVFPLQVHDKIVSARMAEIEWDLLANSPAAAFRNICGTEKEINVLLRGKRIATALKKWIAPDDVVFDVGCGTGLLEKYLGPFCREICAVDISSNMLELAKQTVDGMRNVRFVKTNGMDLDAFADHEFDFSICTNVLHHMKREYAVHYLEELRRVTKPRRYIYIGVPNFLHPKTLNDWFLKKDHHVGLASRVRPFVPDELLAIVVRLGFSVVESTVERDILLLLRNPK